MGRYSFADYEAEQRETWSAVGIFLIVALFAAGPIFLAYQAFQWLRWGQWPTLNIGTWLDWSGLDIPHTDWVGAQRIISWLLSLPLWLVCPLLGCFAFWLMFLWNEARVAKGKPIPPISK